MDRPGIDRDILGAYGRYPLVIKIPQAEMNGGTIGLRYTQYLIEVDDCGKVFTRARRYTMFAWLHAELRRKELACALPELPPKKLFGNRDQAFVDRRRQMLEDYLRALLMLPAVIQDGMIWAFLDADEATAVVPRFLCRQPTHAAADKQASKQARLVAFGFFPSGTTVEIFRLCDSSVLEELANFALAEASEAGHIQAKTRSFAATDCLKRLIQDQGYILGYIRLRVSTASHILAMFVTKRRSSGLAVLLLVAACCSLPTFVMPPTQSTPPARDQLLTAGSAALVASLPAPAHAGGMFDFGLTLPFVAGSFLLLMTVLNALFYAPVSEEMEERNAKLLQTLSDATDMLAEADEMQVTYTAEIKEAREKAAKELAEAREKTEAAIEAQMTAKAAEREKKAADFRAKVQQSMQDKIKSAEGQIEERKATFVKNTLAGVGL
ncbi:atpF2 [Symbiodinium necroappetens]|uniref:AtpF2 protein n=1 Tax=Symbiodinium necroappetens TaxID=1628268 RepID=A0A812SLJ1_9DINO|nr:atpF2 [Symbiodinium necroappetens]